MFPGMADRMSKEVRRKPFTTLPSLQRCAAWEAKLCAYSCHLFDCIAKPMEVSTS